MRSIVYF